jgi:hypothetical protein
MSDIEMYDTTSSRIAVLENEVKNISSDIRELRKEQKEQHEILLKKFGQMDERLGIVERWRWMILGAAVVVGYIIAHVRFEKFF